jgi:hypothetical protein
MQTLETSRLVTRLANTSDSPLGVDGTLDQALGTAVLEATRIA